MAFGQGCVCDIVGHRPQLLRRGHVGHCELMARPVLRDLERGGGAHHQCAVLLHGHAAAGKASSVIVARNGEIQPLVGQPRLSEKGMEAVRRPVRRYRLLHGAQRPRQNLPAVEAQQPAWYGRSSKPVRRSEEHTSELQSLMRISYAVFCLKKKTTKNKPKYHT